MCTLSTLSQAQDRSRQGTNHHGRQPLRQVAHTSLRDLPVQVPMLEQLSSGVTSGLEQPGPRDLLEMRMHWPHPEALQLNKPPGHSGKPRA